MVDSVALKLDCANAQTDPELHYQHMFKGPLLLEMPQMNLFIHNDEGNSDK